MNVHSGTGSMDEELTEKQQAILDATLELIGERGFHGTPMSAIAEKAGVGAGTIYRYYESKEDLINALYVREKRLLNELLLDGYHKGLATRKAIALVWRNYLKARSSHPARIRFIDQYSNSPFIGDETKRVREQLMAEYIEIIERGVREGALRDLPHPVLSAMIMGPITSLAHVGLMYGMAVNDDLIEQLLDTVWRSIGND
jgi:AcrR family transcriptional regulator